MNPQKIRQLLYRHNYKHIPGTIADVFDSEHHRNLRTQKVVLDGKELDHCYFSVKEAMGWCDVVCVVGGRERGQNEERRVREREGKLGTTSTG